MVNTKKPHYISLYLRKKYTNDPSINMLLETAVRVVLSLTCNLSSGRMEEFLCLVRLNGCSLNPLLYFHSGA